MSIATHNRQIALKALELFKQDLEDKDPKPYLNAVQKAMLLLGSQGLRRTVLYITAQMSKDDKAESSNGTLTSSTAYNLLYRHLATWMKKEEEQLQYHILKGCNEEHLAQIEPEAAYFLLCLKRLAESRKKEE